MSKILSSIIFLFLITLPVFGANYYWVGGSGNWSDINHWRTTSGGIGMPGVVPGPNDDVHFDINSGFTTASKTVSLNVPAYCRNIEVSGTVVAPTFAYTADGNTLNIYGSSVWQTGMILGGFTTNYENTGTPKTIASNGVSFGGYVFLKETTSVSLADDFSSNQPHANLNALYVQAGTFNTNNKNIKILNGHFRASGSANKNVTFNLGSSDIIVNGSLYFDTPYLNLNAGTSTIHIKGIYPILNGNSGQVYNDVYFETTGNTVAAIHGGNITFNRVIFNTDGSIYGSNTYKELIFAPAATYVLSNGTTQKIIDLFSAQSECLGWMNIRSDNTNSATISMPAGAIVDVSGVVLSRINATGGASFIANGSIDEGANTGWTFTPMQELDLYWVGGSGKWDEPAHWSTISGGTGGACVPTPGSNVFFDANSGFTNSSKTVTILGSAFCNNIIFSGGPIAPIINYNFDTSSTLNIYGSSVLQAGMQFAVYNIHYRNSGTPKTITSNDVEIKSNQIQISETTATTFIDKFNISTGTITLNDGIMNTNNNEIKAYQLKATDTNRPKILNFGSSQIYIGYRTLLNNSSVTLNAGTSHIHILSGAGYIHTYQEQVYYDLTFESQSVGTSNISNNGGSISTNPRFNRVEFKSRGQIFGNNTFAHLILAPGQTYTLGASSGSSFTQTITQSFSLSSGCLGWATLESSATDFQAVLSAPSTASINVSGVMMKNIKATGGATFTANRSIDNGGNTGWVFTPPDNFDLYWVGGSGNWNDPAHWALTSGGTGGVCVPSLNNNVFIDANSGFTSASKNITMQTSNYCRNITCSGSTGTAPAISGPGSFYIYGSSVWTSGMYFANTVTIYYQDTGSSKTITSNGASFHKDGYINIYETSSVSLLDDISAGALMLYKGTFNSNGHKMELSMFSSFASYTTPVSISLGSSDIYILYYAYLDSEYTKVDAGTSHIHMMSSGSKFITYSGQVYHNVTFESETADVNSLELQSFASSSGNETKFARVEFKSGGTLTGHNIFDELFFAAGGTYVLTYGTGAGSAQTVNKKLTMSGNPCDILFIRSSSPGTQVSLKLLAGRNDFNFVNIKDINATGGKTLHLGDKSTVAGQNNTNVTYDAYNPGEFDGFDAGYNCYTIDEDTHTLSSDGFYGNEYTKYSWFNQDNPSQIISTDKSIDLLNFGYGNYIVRVEYNEDCVIEGRVSVIKQTDKIVTDSKPIRVCISATNTLDNIRIAAQDVKWYATATSTDTLPPTTVITDGSTYYATQTIDSCESKRIPVTVKLTVCKNIYINPNLRFRVSQ